MVCSLFFKKFTVAQQLLYDDGANTEYVGASPERCFVSDAVYTERYMHRPEENSDSYKVRGHISHILCI